MGERDRPRRVRSVAEYWLETILFNSRWLLVPFYLGLVFGLLTLLLAFAMEFAREVVHIGDVTPEGAILISLSLVDLSLVASLILIVIFAGYENFVSKIEVAGVEDRPAWMGTVDFAGVKLKLVGSMVAISGISLLRTFMKMGDGEIDETQLKWRVILHLTFVIAGVLMALMDLLASRAKSIAKG